MLARTVIDKGTSPELGMSRASKWEIKPVLLQAILLFLWVMTLLEAKSFPRLLKAAELR